MISADSPTIDHTKPTSLIDALCRIVGEDNVLRSDSDRQFYSQDIFTQGIACAVVVRPHSADEIARIAIATTASGYDLVTRGGGMSYTAGYLPVRPQSVIIDMARMNHILEINQTDMYVTVEAGCTWDSLRRALEPTGLRSPYWGPLSGLKSTIGGALSQNSVFFGSGLNGTAADTVIGMTIVRADGAIVTTGSAGGTNANAFFRHYGPDLTGLFTGDAGAFGIKVAATLRLVKRKPAQRYASFAFDDRHALITAMQSIARDGLATECFAFDPFLQSVRMKRAGLMSDVQTLAAVVQGQGSIVRGLKEGLRMAVAGRRFAKGVDWPLHVALEERNDPAADAALEDVRMIAIAAGGRETENTVPKAVHAAPFGPMNGMVGVDGERWVPVHGVVPNSRVERFFAALDALYRDRADDMDRHGVTSGYLITTIGPGASLIEPVFYWPDALMDIHTRSVEPAFLAKLPRHQPQEDARAFVAQLRRAVIDLFVDVGAIHFQIGKTYPLHRTRSPGAADLLDDIKARLDPNGAINPGALGLAG
ncbi:MAG: FAD-binding oxidoreductase [Sphingomonas sp.]|uniref:FAD-binding oxidoreductase n=1 Tax=Sphingomonas sp. TaxID=28214 RepID=UPI0035A921F1|nr:FAD-binding oxidoreductase [Sphingomonas sp.]